MTNVETLKQTILDSGYEDVVVFENPDYANACIGVSSTNRAVYSYSKMLECLMKEDNMTEEEAVDFISYNTIRACDYVENSPIIVYDLIR